MTDTIFRKTLFISLLGHLTIFSIFNLSFGYKLPNINSANVSFWGGILSSPELTPLGEVKAKILGTSGFFKHSTPAIRKTSSEFLSISGYYIKPALFLVFKEEKLPFIYKVAGPLPPQKRESSTVMFYPQLPYHFLLYFKDRQVAHIELMFNITSGPANNFIEVRRKVSSGNLEADLLTTRYISHYLFIQQGNFSPNNWQKVRIDLSTRND